MITGEGHRRFVIEGGDSRLFGYSDNSSRLSRFQVGGDCSFLLEGEVKDVSEHPCQLVSTGLQWPANAKGIHPGQVASSLQHQHTETK